MFSARFLVERLREGGARSANTRGRAGFRVSNARRFSLGISLLDLKLGVRMLFKYPGLTLVGMFAMSVGIAIAAGFHAGTEGFIHPNLPIPESDRVVAVWNVDLRNSRLGTQTLGDMVTWRESLGSLEDVGTFTTRPRVVTMPDGQTFSVRAAQISPSAFQVLRVPPLLGRPLLADDERPDGPPVAIVGFDLWQSAFGSDSTIVGKTIRLGGVQHSVVGVMPRGFAFPIDESLWTPLRVAGPGIGPGDGQRVSFSVGRLASGTTIADAQAELLGVGARLAADHPETHGQLRPRVAPYADAYLEADDPGAAADIKLIRLLIATVLVIAAVNVGTLVYSRNAARAGEISVRSALGAGRSRIVLQMFVEALVLASIAGMVGVGITLWGLHQVTALMHTPYLEGAPYWWEARMGPSTVLWVVGLTLGAAVLTGVLPALKVTGRGVRSRLQRVGAGESGLRFGRVASGVVVVQVTISMALLIVVGAIQRQFSRGPALDDGIARDDYVATQLRMDREPALSDVDGDRAASFARDTEIWRELARRVSQEPGVLGVTLGTSLPGMDHSSWRIQVEGASTRRRARIARVEPNYFDVFDMPVRVGRAFDAADAADSVAGVAVVNEAFVRSVLAAGQPIGQRFRLLPRGGRPAGPWVEVVGVVRDVVVDLTTPVGVVPAFYLPLVPDVGRVYLAAHVQDEPSQFVGRLRDIAGALDPALMLHRPGPLQDLVGISALRLLGIAIGLLVAAALVLSTAGVYALMSFTVTQRTREIGIRTALGASPRRIVGDVFSRAIGQLAVGTSLGLGLGILAMGGILSRQGPEPIVGIAVLIIVMGLVACGKPMSRALRIEPTEALREGG